MSPTTRPGAASSLVSASDAADRREDRDWVVELRTPGSVADAALRELHQHLLRASRHRVNRLVSGASGYDRQQCDDLAQSAADDALVAVLRKLSTFEGRSQFTTWAYKFAVFEAGRTVRRELWAKRPLPLDELDQVDDPAPGPAENAEVHDLAMALTRAIHDVLTPYQRRITLALLVDEVPIDVLAERLGTTRGALYKTLHMARRRLRAELVRTGHLPASTIRSAAATTTSRGDDA